MPIQKKSGNLSYGPCKSSSGFDILHSLYILFFFFKKRYLPIVNTLNTYCFLRKDTFQYTTLFIHIVFLKNSQILICRYESLFHGGHLKKCNATASFYMKRIFRDASTNGKLTEINVLIDMGNILKTMFNSFRIFILVNTASVKSLLEHTFILKKPLTGMNVSSIIYKCCSTKFGQKVKKLLKI